MYRFAQRTLLVVIIFLVGAVQAHGARASRGPRTVLVPFVVTGNGGVDPAYSLRLAHLVSRALGASGWEVVRPFSPDIRRRRCQRMLRRYEDHPVAFARRLLRDYWADLVYVIRADISISPQPPGAYRAEVKVVGQGYTRRGGDVATVARRFTVTDATEAGAVEAALMRIRHGLALRLARWRSGFPVVGRPLPPPNLHAGRHIRIYLQGATDDDLVELFDSIIANTPGVRRARRIRSRLEPRDPGRSIVVWDVETDGIDPFFIESNIMDTLKDEYAVERLVENRDQEASVDPGVMDDLKWIRPGDASTRKLCFVVDWCAAGDPRCAAMGRFRGRCALDRWRRRGPDRGFE